MKVIVLGSGPSYGIPSLTRGFGDCDPENVKNIRTRSSVLIQKNKTTVLIDTSPEIKEQLLKQNSPVLDALLYTHVHYDHCGGAEDVKKMIQDRECNLDVYGQKKDIVKLMDKFDYVFKKDKCFNMHTVKMYHPFKIKDLEIIPIHQKHGNGTSVGYRIGSFAYTTDVKKITPNGWKVLQGVKTWLLGCPTTKENNKHVHLKEALKWIEKIKPQKAYLTHLGLHMDYEKLKKDLPANVIPCYDGIIIDEKY